MAMLVVAGAFSGFLVYRGAWFPLIALALSQFPFWMGYAVSFVGEYHPVKFNMFTDMIVSGIFVWLGYQINKAWLIWLGVVFLCALLVDLFALIFGMNNYFELHEFLHYTAMAVIAGRQGVVRVDRHIRGALSGAQN